MGRPSSSSRSRGGGPPRSGGGGAGAGSRDVDRLRDRACTPPPSFGWSPFPFWGGLVALLLALPAAALAAPPVITSSAPDKVAVTLYRDPQRGEGPINRSDPSSFALIVETRTVTLPPGE